MSTIALMTENGWRPGIGDPDFLGWATTITYFLVAGLCAWAWRGERSLGWRARITVRPMAWMTAGALLVLLGVNKQLDLHLWVYATGKALLKSGGLWQYRMPVTGAFVATLAAVGAAGSYALLRYVGPARARYRMMFAGLACLGGFVVIRAGSSIPGFDLISGRHLQVMHLLLEFSSLITIGIGAARALGHVQERARVEQQNALAMGGGGIRVNEATRPVPQAERAATRRAA